MFQSLFPSLNDRDCVEEENVTNSHPQALLLQQKMNYINHVESTLSASASAPSGVCLVQCDHNHLAEMIKFWEGRKMHQLNNNFLARNNGNTLLATSTSPNSKINNNSFVADREFVVFDQTHDANSHVDQQQDATPISIRSHQQLDAATRNESGSPGKYAQQHFNNNNNNQVKFDPEDYFNLRFSLGLQFALTTNRMNGEGNGAALYFRKSPNLNKDEFRKSNLLFQKGKWNDFHSFFAHQNKENDQQNKHENRGDDEDDVLHSENDDDLKYDYTEDESAFLGKVLQVQFGCTDHIPTSANNTRINAAPFVDLLNQRCDVVDSVTDHDENNDNLYPIFPELKRGVVDRDESQIYRSVGDISRKVLAMAGQHPPCFDPRNPPTSIEEMHKMEQDALDAWWADNNQNQDAYISCIVVDLAGVEGSQDKIQLLHLLNCLNIFTESRRRAMMWRTKKNLNNNNIQNLRFELSPRFPNAQCLVFVGDKVVNFATTPCHSYNNNNWANKKPLLSGIPPTFLDGLVSGILMLTNDHKAFYTNLSCLSFSPSFLFAEKNNNNDNIRGQQVETDRTPNKNDQNTLNNLVVPSILGVNVKFVVTEGKILNVDAS